MLFPVVEPGVKLAVTPLGNPLAVQETADVKLVRVMLIVLVPFVPRFTVKVLGLAETVKFGVVPAEGVAET
jgi:hypothetical protein